MPLRETVTPLDQVRQARRLAAQTRSDRQQRRFRALVLPPGGATFGGST
jgi:hypothetical protein